MAIRPQQTTPGTSSTSKRLHIRWTRLKITILVMALVVLIAAGGVGWWLFSPLFFHDTAKDANPFASSVPPAGATAAGGSTPVTSTTVVTGKSGPVILATGKFIDTGAKNGRGLANDHGSGNVTIGRTADGKYFIHLDHLNVTNGPDLHVYLDSQTNPNDPNQVKNGGTDLGLLSATEASVNVAVPYDIGANLMKYHSVVILCKTFAVIFTVAPLQFAAGV